MKNDLKVRVLGRDGRGRLAAGPGDLEGVGRGDEIWLSGKAEEIPAALSMMVGLAVLRGATANWGGAR